MTQAILLGAGKGTRLKAASQGAPKWTIEVAGQSLAQHLVNALHACDITEILLARGPTGGRVLTPSVLYRDPSINRNMVDTLSQLRDDVYEDVLILYCDLILEPRIISALLHGKGDACVAVDVDWRRLFTLRSDDPLSIAESCLIEGDTLKEVGQPLRGSVPDAQYLGAMRFSYDRFHQLLGIYDAVVHDYAGRPWRNASTVEAAYMTDLLQETIDQNIPLTATRVSGGWLEFDTPRDLKLARDIANSAQRDVFDFAKLSEFPYVVSAGGFAIRIEDAAKQVLLVGSGRDGEWRAPKGMLKPGETRVLAAAREVREEAGVPVEVGELADVAEWIYDHGDRRWRERCYFYNLTATDSTPPCPDAEHPVAAWVPASTAATGMRFAEERRALERALAR